MSEINSLTRNETVGEKALRQNSKQGMESGDKNVGGSGCAVSTRAREPRAGDNIRACKRPPF